MKTNAFNQILDTQRTVGDNKKGRASPALHCEQRPVTAFKSKVTRNSSTIQVAPRPQRNGAPALQSSHAHPRAPLKLRGVSPELGLGGTVRCPGARGAPRRDA